MGLINCPECGKEISDTAKKCPNCGFSLKKFSPENKKRKKIIIVVLCCVLALGIIFGVIMIAFPNLFRSVDGMLKNGDYASAYKAASTEEQKLDIVRENAVAFCSADAVDMLKDPTSFILKSGAMLSNKRSAVVLEVVAKNSYGSNVTNYWFYDYDDSTQSYSYAASFSNLSHEDLSDYSLDDKVSVATRNRCKSVLQIAMYNGGLNFISDEAIDRINELFKAGKLKKIDLIELPTK